MSEKKYRSFKIKEADGTFRGRYLGESPYQAANKALSEIIRKDKNVNTNNIIVQNTTCCAILKSGSRKGQECGAKTKTDFFCLRHAPKQ